MARYLDPRNHLVFWRVFSKNAHLMKSFLNALMPLQKGQRIDKVSMIPFLDMPHNPLNEFATANVHCTDNYGQQFTVVILIQWTDVFIRTMTLNTIYKFSSRTDYNDSFSVTQPIYGLAILNETFDYETSEFFHRFHMPNYKNAAKIGGGIELVMFELPKFNPETISKNDMTTLWLYFLKKTESITTEILEKMIMNSEIREALILCEEDRYSEGDIYKYDHYWMEISNEKNLLNNSFKEGRAKGRAKGMEEGRAKGMEEGRAKGMEEGRAKGMEEGRTETAFAIVCNLLKKGFSPKDIAELTGFTVDEINKLDLK